MYKYITKNSTTDFSIREGDVETQVFEAFSRSPLITRKCTAAINSLLLLHIKEGFAPESLKGIFISVLRSFQSKEMYLKHMVYLAIETVGPKTPDSFLAINSLCKDLNKVDRSLKPGCIRSLFSIIPAQMLNDFEKILAQSYSTNKMAMLIYYDLLCRNKITASVGESSGDNLWQMAFVFELKKSDKNFLLGFLKKNQYAKGEEAIFVVKLAFYLYQEDRKAVSELIKKFLTIKYNEEGVFVEAAIRLLELEDEEIFTFVVPVVQSVRSLLRTTNPVLKFAAVRILNMVAKRFPRECESVNPEIEELVNDRSRNIGILALMTVLQIGTEKSIDRFISKVSKAPINDSYKYLLFDSMTSLCAKFPNKSSNFVQLYKNALVEKAHLDFKIFLVNKIGEIIRYRREDFVSILSEYIEDSQHFLLTIHILGILGREIPHTKQPKRHLIHVINRLILENSHVRVAALQTISNVSKASNLDFFGILRKCTRENDEMVRDVALFLLNNSERGDALKPSDFEGFEEVAEDHFRCENKIRDTVKECRAIPLSEPDADISVSVQKTVFEGRVVLKIKVENTLSSILLKSGRLVILMRHSEGDEEFHLQYSNLAFGESKVDELEITNKDILRLSMLNKESIGNIQHRVVFNSVIEYRICPENDFTDVEHETRDLDPFEIVFVDFFLPKMCEKVLDFSKSVSFVLASTNLEEVVQKVLRFLNLKIVCQNQDGFGQIILNGSKEDLEVRVAVDLWMGDSVHGNIDVLANEQALADGIVGLFE